MQIPLKLSFHQLDPSPAVEAFVSAQADQLERFCSRITSVRVTIQLSSLRHHPENLYHITIDITIPGNEIAICRNPSQGHVHEDIYLALREAFHTARRQLDDYSEIHFQRKSRRR